MAAGGGKNVATPGQFGFQTPDIGAITGFAGQQNATRIRDTYANLGIGGTPEAMDLAGSNLATAAEGAQLQFAENTQAIQAANAQNQAYAQQGSSLGSLGTLAGLLG